MNEDESFRSEKEILEHFGNLKAALVRALKTGVFQNFDEATQIKISIAVVENYIEESFVGAGFDK